MKKTIKAKRNSMKRKKKSILKRLIRRDGFQCANCGYIPHKSHIPLEGNRYLKYIWCPHLEIDHIKPLRKGGGNSLNNLQILCNICNCIKGTCTDDSWKDSPKLKNHYKNLEIWKQMEKSDG